MADFRLQAPDFSPLWNLVQMKRQDEQIAYERSRQEKADAQSDEMFALQKRQILQQLKAAENEGTAEQMARNYLANATGIAGDVESILVSLEQGVPQDAKATTRLATKIQKAQQEMAGTQYADEFKQLEPLVQSGQWEQLIPQLNQSMMKAGVFRDYLAFQEAQKGKRPEMSVEERKRAGQISYYTDQLVRDFGLPPQAAQDWAFAVANDDVIVNFNPNTSETYLTNKGTGQTIFGSMGAQVAQGLPNAQELPAGVTPQTGRETMAPSMWEASKSVGPISAISAASDQFLGILGFPVNDENLRNRQTLKINTFDLIEGFKSDDRVTDSEREFILQYADPKSWNQPTFQAQLIANDNSLRRKRAQLQDTISSNPSANVRQSAIAQMEFIDKYLQIMDVPQLRTPEDIMSADPSVITSWRDYARSTTNPMSDWSDEMVEAFANRWNMMRSQ